MIKIIDNFFEDPDAIVEYAKGLNYKDTGNHYPGVRTDCLSKIDGEMYEKIIKMFITPEIELPPNVEADIRFQLSPPQWELGLVHKDDVLTGIVYLNKHKDPEINTGTSFFVPKKKVEDINLQIDYKYYVIDEKHYPGYHKLVKQTNDQFYKTATADGLYNRAVCFSGDQWHAAEKFDLDKNGEERLTLVMFITKI